MPDFGEPIGFLAFRRDEDGDISEFAVIAGGDALERWKAGSLRLPEKPETTTDLNGSVEDREDGPQIVVIESLDYLIDPENL